MKIKVNGKEQMVDKESATVSDLLAICSVEQPDMVSVQLNGEFVKKEDFNNAHVKENDEVDFLYFMGGGR